MVPSSATNQPAAKCGLLRGAASATVATGRSLVRAVAVVVVLLAQTLAVVVLVV